VIAVQSLHARVALLLVLMLGALSTAFAGAGWYYAGITAGGAYDALLRAGAAQIAENTYLQGSMVTVDLPVSVLAGLSAADRVAYKVVDPRGVVIAGAADLETGIDTPAQQEALQQSGLLLRDGTWRGEKVRIAVTTRLLGQGWAVMAVAQTLHARTALARDIAGTAIVAVLLVSGLAMLVTLLAIKRVLAPLARVQAALRERDPRDLGPLVVVAPPEIASLVGAINSFMARLERRTGMMQRMIGDAAHQMRTPLAALASQIDMLSVEQDAGRRTAQMQRVAARTEQLGRLVGQLFSHAMVTHRPEVVEPLPVNLMALVRQAMMDMPQEEAVWGRPMPSMALDAPGAPVIITGDAISLREAFLNIVGNAIRHGATTRLEVRIGQQGPEVLIEVVDDGPGIPPALWARVREPFHDRPDNQKGAGLGLAIASEVVGAHGGEMRFRRDSEDGFAVILAFPAHAALHPESGSRKPPSRT
jgi:two-component system sensor histidine kinase TctE